MHAITGAVEARVEALGFPVYVGDATGADAYPYVLLLPPGGAPDPDTNLAGDRRPMRDLFMVRAVGQATQSALALLSRTRPALSNNGRPVTFDTADGAWRVTFTRDGAQPLTVDRDVQFTGTNAHPVFVTDEYTMTAVPLTP